QEDRIGEIRRVSGRSAAAEAAAAPTGTTWATPESAEPAKPARPGAGLEPLDEQPILEPFLFGERLQLFLEVRRAVSGGDEEVRRLPGDAAADAAASVAVRGCDLLRRDTAHVERLQQAVLDQRHRCRRDAVVVHGISAEQADAVDRVLR